MFCFHEKVAKQDLGGGIILQELGHGQNMNVLHWNMQDGSVVKLHNHPQEQFGYVIKGGFKMIVGGEETILKAGDAYFISPNIKHSFTATGETEAIDVFNPIKKDFPWKE